MPTPIGASSSRRTVTGIVRRAPALWTDVDAQTWRALTFGTAAATGAALAFAPIVSTSSCSATSTGISSCTSSQESLVANEGATVVLVLVLPALMALVPVVARTRRSTVLAAALLTVATMLGLASIGIFFIPTVVLAWVGVGASRQLEVGQQPHRSSAP